MLVDASKGNTCWLETKSATFASRFSPPRVLPLPLSDHSASQMRRDLRNFFNSAPQRDFRPSCNIVREFSSIDFEPPLNFHARSPRCLDEFARALTGDALPRKMISHSRIRGRNLRWNLKIRDLSTRRKKSFSRIARVSTFSRIFPRIREHFANILRIVQSRNYHHRPCNASNRKWRIALLCQEFSRECSCLYPEHEGD